MKTDFAEGVNSNSCFFTFYGYDCSIREWFIFTKTFFEENDFPLKSVLSDWARETGNKRNRSSMAKFEKTFGPDFDMETFVFLSSFYAQKQNFPSTIYYDASIIRDINAIQLQFNLCIDVKIAVSFMLSYTTSFLKHFALEYGIFYQLNSENTYCFGDPPGFHLYDETFDNWGNTIMYPQKPQYYQQGYFRHIYETNLLNETHLKQKINGLYLEEWINKNQNGTITKIGERNWLWEIPPDKMTPIAIEMQKEFLLVDVKTNSASEKFLLPKR